MIALIGVFGGFILLAGVLSTKARQNLGQVLLALGILCFFVHGAGLGIALLLAGAGLIWGQPLFTARRQLPPQPPQIQEEDRNDGGA